MTLPDYTESQVKATQMALKVAAFLSLSGSGFIVYNLVSQRSKELTKTLNRLLLGLSLCDFLSSSWFFIGSWAVPKDSIHGEFFYGNAGTQTTCSVQGFFLQWFVAASVFYTACLSLFFLLLVRYQWPERKIQRAEYGFHAVSITVSLLPAIAMLVNDMYNPVLMGMCYVGPYPWGCDKKDSEIDCIRGEGVAMYRLFGWVAPFFVCFVTILTSMVLIYLAVRQSDKRSGKYASRWVQRNNRNTKAAVQKAGQFIGAFLFTWTPTLFGIFYFELLKSVVWPFGFMMVANSTYPVNGFLNAMVYAKILDKMKQRCLCAWIRGSVKKNSSAGTTNTTTVTTQGPSTTEELRSTLKSTYALHTRPIASGLASSSLTSPDSHRVGAPADSTVVADHIGVSVAATTYADETNSTTSAPDDDAPNFTADCTGVSVAATTANADETNSTTSAPDDDTPTAAAPASPFTAPIIDLPCEHIHDATTTTSDDPTIMVPIIHSSTGTPPDEHFITPHVNPTTTPVDSTGDIEEAAQRSEPEHDDDGHQPEEAPVAISYP